MIDAGTVDGPATRTLLKADADVDLLEEQCAGFTLVRDLLEADELPHTTTGFTTFSERFCITFRDCPNSGLMPPSDVLSSPKSIHPMSISS